MVNILFIGSVYPNKLKNELLHLNTHIDFAAHTFQSALLKGLDKFTRVKVISSPVIKMSKKVKRGFDPYSFSHAENGEERDIYIGTKNGLFFKLYEFFQVRRYLKKSITEDPYANILIYALHSPFLLALCSIRSVKGKTCVVVPDLPAYMSGNKSLFYKIAKRIDRLIIDICLRRIDKYVLLSPYMKEVLPVGNKPWIQLEGIYCANTSTRNTIKEKRKSVLYTGGIDSRYGVFDLIEAFTQIEGEDYELWLCGGCKETGLLDSYLKKDSRIKYFGMVDKDLVTELQHRATVLVNPRHSTEEFTKYSFPSKTMEYLASGTPTVMCKLPAMSDEYLPHLYIFQDETINGYKQTIIDIMSKPQEELSRKGARASEFILSLKNETIQANKIIKLLNEL